MNTPLLFFFFFFFFFFKYILDLILVRDRFDVGGGGQVRLVEFDLVKTL
jgi:hypothetical protein